MATVTLSATGTNDGTAINTAISGANDGDTIFLYDGTYDIDTQILTRTGLKIEGQSESGTILKANASLSGQVIYASNNSGTYYDNNTFKNFTIDGNGDNTTNGIHGLQLRNSSGHTITDVTVKNVRGHHVMYYGVDSCTTTRLTTDKNVTMTDTTSHGVDIDLHTTTKTTNCTFTDCVLNNGWGTSGGRQCLKAESCRSITVTNCTFNSEVVFGDNVTPTDVGITLDNCTFNRQAFVNLRNSGYGPTFDTCTFGDFGGVIIVTSDSNDCTVTDCTFNGKNTIIGYNQTTWISLTSVTETGTIHTNKTTTGGTALFSSLVDNGSEMYGVGVTMKPYVTPAMAHSNLETLIEDTSLDKDRNCFHILSGYGDQTVTAALNGITFATANTNACVEGYPGTAVIDLASADTDLFNNTLNTNLTFRKLHFKNFAVAGVSAIRAVTGTILIDECKFSDMTASSANAIEVRDAGSYHVKSCEFYNLNPTAGTGAGIYVNGVSAITLDIEGCKFYDSTLKNSIVQLRNVGATYSVKGCEFYNLTGTDATQTGALGLDQTTTVENCTFYGNSSTTAQYEDIRSGVAQTVTNCMFDDNNTTTGTITFNNCNSAGTAFGGGSNNTNVASPYTDAANDDFTLISGTACVGGGVGSATNNFVGANGEPMANFGRDIGANQSSHGPFHPVNL